MDKDSQKQWFKGAYDLREKRYDSGYGWPLEVDSTFKKFFSIIQKSSKHGKMLDLGCGQGRHSIYCAENGFESYGIDYVERAIEDAKEKVLEKDISNAHFKVMDILNLNFPKDYFDLIVDWSVLDHIRYTEWDLYLKNILSVLKVGGFLILSEFSSKDSIIDENRKAYEHKDKPFPNSLYWEDDNHYDHYFSEDEIKNLFSKNFEIISIEESTIPAAKMNSAHLMINVLLKRKN